MLEVNGAFTLPETSVIGQCERPGAVSDGEELLQHGSEDLRGYSMVLTFQGVVLRIGEDVGEGLRRTVHIRRARPTVNDERWHRDGGDPLGRHGGVSHDGAVVGQRVRHSLERRPEWRVSHLGNDFDRNVRPLVMKNSTASPRRPDDIS
jgi:hypothetical protein